MNEKKKLIINAVHVDATNLTEETASLYESITLNSALVLFSPQSKEISARYAITINAANVVCLLDGATAQIVNGLIEIHPDEVVPEHSVLIANGSVVIHPGCEGVIDKYALCRINGSLLCPDTLRLPANLKLNGEKMVYPEGATLLKKATEIDRLFLLRAKSKTHYHVLKKILLLDETLDFVSLEQKEIRFTGREAVCQESLLETVLPILDEKMEIIVIPNGYVYVPGDICLSELLLMQYGAKLYIDGDLTITSDTENLLEKLERIEVRGTAIVPSELQKRFFTKCKKTGALCEPEEEEGNYISDRSELTVDTALLKAAENGLFISDCETVTFLPDVPPQLIQEKLKGISDCVKVKCSNEQRAFLELIADDCMQIGAQENKKEDEIVINTASYMF